MDEKRLPVIIFLLPIAALLLTISIFLYSYNIQQKKIMNNNLEYVKNLYIKHAIEMEKNKINAAFDIFTYNCDNVENILKPKLKKRVDMVYKIMQNLYKENKNLPRNKIIQIIKAAIDPIRFDNGKGYFFIYNLKGVNILLPPDKSSEGKNLIEFRDAVGEYPIKKTLSLLKKQQCGFVEWYWYKPKGGKYKLWKSRMHKKIGYICLFKPLNWFVGTGSYVEDEKREIQHNFIKLYTDEKRKNGEYFLVLRFLWSKSAEVLGSSFDIDTKYITENYADKKGMQYIKKVFDSIYSGKKQGIVKCRRNSTNKKADDAYVYFRLYKDNILVISCFDINDIKLIIDKAKLRYKSVFGAYIEDMFMVSFIIILTIGGLFIFISKGVNGILFRYQEDVKKKEEELKELASHDELTRIYNRRKFEEILDYEINMSLRYNRRLSLIMFDLDHFKRINDRYGHPIGDKVLKIISRLVKNSIRLTDTFARWGGEEFVIILPSTGIEDAVKMAENLRMRIENVKFGSIGTITCSFGVTEFRKDDDKYEFIARMDKALYIAKNKGRNRVEFL